MKELNPEKKDQNINIKCTKYERNKLKELADKYCGGRLSRWLLIAGLTWRPEKTVKDDHELLIELIKRIEKTK